MDERRRTRPPGTWARWIMGGLLLAIGLFLAIGGARLLQLGGSWYFLPMGIAMVLAGVLVALGRVEGAWVYGAAMLVTVVWALIDAGLAFWPLVSRLFAMGVLALLVALVYPGLALRSRRDPARPAAYGVAAFVALCLVAAGVSAFTPKNVRPAAALAAVKPVSPEARQTDWMHWGNTTRGDRFAALDQITKDNVKDLQVAWTAHTGDIPQSTGAGAEDQNTPLQIGDTLYLCTAYSKAIALDADTGQERWRYDPQAKSPAWQRCRGMGYFAEAGATPAGGAAASSAAAAATPAAGIAPAQPSPPAAEPATEPATEPARSDTTPAAPSQTPPPPVAGAELSTANRDGSAPPPEAAQAPSAGTPSGAPASSPGTATAAGPGTCARRLFLPTIDARLIALDADTGKPCGGFGDNGTVDLKVGMGVVKDGYFQQTSTPLVAGEVVVIGGRIADNYSTDEPPGVVRAYDVRSGRLVWAWDPGNPAVTREPPAGGTYTLGTPNVWAAMAYDPKLDLIYLPTGNATPDFFGGQRTAMDDRYNSSVVAVEARTGKVRWSFQMTHHDLWDFDVPAQPLLYDVPLGNGATAPALIQVTKQGMIFMLNRETGQPIAAVEERAVPQGNVPGERYSPTQPFSVGMPMLGNETLNESDMWGATPMDQLLCRIQFKKMRHQGVYTPPGLDPALQFPGSLGGMNWGSVAVDPTTHYMFVNDMRLGLANYMIPRDKIPKNASGIEMGVVPQEGTPFGAMRQRFLSQLGIPCQKPPFGTMTAIDLKTRQIVWQVPVGTVKDTGPFGIPMGLPIPIGMPTLGPSLATQSGLLFFAGTQDFYLRAFDSGTGKELARFRMPVGSQGGPMTYVSPRTGRQYVVITAGGARQSPDRGDLVIAYALPERKTAP